MVANLQFLSAGNSKPPSWDQKEVLEHLLTLLFKLDTRRMILAVAKGLKTFALNRHSLRKHDHLFLKDPLAANISFLITGFVSKHSQAYGPMSERISLNRIRYADDDTKSRRESSAKITANLKLSEARYLKAVYLNAFTDSGKKRLNELCSIVETNHIS